MNWCDLVFRADGWEEGVPFFEEAQAADGQRIVTLSQECAGYWNLELEDGTKLYAVHTVHIVPTY